MSGGKLHGESFCIAVCFSNRLVFLLKILLRESWSSSEIETTRGGGHTIPTWDCSVGSMEPFSPPAPHVSIQSNAAHKMPVSTLRKAVCFNKRDHVDSVLLRNTEFHNERQHLQEH